jgi:hypothetical protein
MTSMVLGDSTLESLTPSVNAPLKVWKDIYICILWTTQTNMTRLAAAAAVAVSSVYPSLPALITLVTFFSFLSEASSRLCQPQ